MQEKNSLRWMWRGEKKTDHARTQRSVSGLLLRTLRTVKQKAKIGKTTVAVKGVVLLRRRVTRKVKM